MRYKNGFSLIEVIITITILGVIGVITSTILTRTYRANTQSDTISNLKNNGELAINSITEVLRNAEGVICYSAAVDTPSKSMVVRTLSGKYVKLEFIDPVGTTQNGYVIKQENLNPTDINSFCTSNLSSPVPVIITDRNPTAGVSITDGAFTRIQRPNNKDLITIAFSVRPNLSSSGALSSDIFKVQTTIQIR